MASKKPTSAQCKVLKELLYPETLLSYRVSENPYVEGQMFEFAGLINETIAFDLHRYPTIIPATFKALKKAGWIELHHEFDRDTAEYNGRTLKGHESYWVISEEGKQALKDAPLPKPLTPDYDWAWQPFGPDKGVMCFVRLGHHYRGFPVIKVTDEQREMIKVGSRFEFKYKSQRYVCEAGTVQRL